MSSFKSCVIVERIFSSKSPRTLGFVFGIGDGVGVADGFGLGAMGAGVDEGLFLIPSYLSLHRASYKYYSINQERPIGSDFHIYVNLIKIAEFSFLNSDFRDFLLHRLSVVVAA